MLEFCPDPNLHNHQLEKPDLQGGLTVIANAPNPAGQSILKKYFENGVSPAGLLKAAIVPTAIVWLVFLVFS